MPKYSALDLAAVPSGSTPAAALDNAVLLARHVEALGFHRFWVAEHHNMVGIASAATAVVIGRVAAATNTIRVGAGGIMLPNHAPLTVAEQFGTLETFHPGRIDLGLGRAPGSDGHTLKALRRSPMAADNFPGDVQELISYFAPASDDQVVRAVPGAGLDIPIWILGSGLFGAELAAKLGLPFAFASHFAPAALGQALNNYRQSYKPSAANPRPYAMVAANVVIADTDAEARYLFTSQQQHLTNLVRNRFGLLPQPVADIDDYWSPPERMRVSDMLALSFVGSPSTVRAGLDLLQASMEPDEIIVVTPLTDMAKRLRSFELLAQTVAIGRFAPGDG